MPVFMALWRILKAFMAYKAVKWTLGTGAALALGKWSSGILQGFFDDVVLTMESLPAHAVALISIAGIFEAMSIVFSAFLTGLSYRVYASRVNA